MEIDEFLSRKIFAKIFLIFYVKLTQQRSYLVKWLLKIQFLNKFAQICAKMTLAKVKVFEIPYQIELDSA